MKGKHRFLVYLEAAIPALIMGVMGIVAPFFVWDAYLSDKMYADISGASDEIKIIAVDEETLARYGEFDNWSREKLAELTELLFENEETEPALLGMDFLLIDEKNKEADEKLRTATKPHKDKIYWASNLVYRGATVVDAIGQRYFDEFNIDMVETPRALLGDDIRVGYSNTYMAEDGCVRYTKPIEEYNGQSIYSFAYAIYSEYMIQQGEEPVLGKRDAMGNQQIFFSGMVGEFAHFSLCDVLEGKIPIEEFTDSIVLVGAYAPGFQDSYRISDDRSNPMNGVEIHANLIQAFMEQKTAIPVNILLYVVITGIIQYIFYLIGKRQKLLPIMVEGIILIGLHIIAGKILATKGIIIPQLYFLILIAAQMLYFIILKYFWEKQKRRKVLSVFKRYVAPQVVEEIAGKGTYELKLGGEKRDIAVLFVDIRGFTTMSEILTPEQVVQILNEYLALTTASVLENNGTLDKFIGDATMAVFNAPFDMDDYVFKAVKTAIAMREGSKALSEKLEKEFGRTVSFGIGVNCGEAVVGNIGCEFRMDYTAIGDTVNTAARLESRAGAGEILISEAVYQRIGDRIEAEPVGEMELKGKSRGVTVYKVRGI